ncbi:hypothetical protein RHSIM_Rhsim12G0111700 [Rhododendron simsii]|uniref:Uncharacterized protein n=1 Tax=Rhododendron simsii TaxID=118357 RepID=A0A834G5H6_RHOSS|nr:hypothetical protein RHSIM_Rhsim12G0111700 [Rhododendron simsii]
MGLFSGASIFDTIADDYDLHWDLASLDDDFNFNGDLDSHANKASKSKPMLACTEERVDNNQGFHAFPTPPKGVEEMVPDTSSLQAPPSPPPFSTSGMGYSIDYQPLSSYLEKQLAMLLLGGLVMCLSRNKVCNDEQARCNILGSAYFAFKC